MLGSSTHDNSNGSYDSLWEELETFVNKNLPKSAYEIAEKIYDKAQDENRDDQLIKAIIYKSKLKSQFEDYDPADYIDELDKERNELNSAAGKAIMASLLGELHHLYVIHNVHRFGNRTELSSNAGALESLKHMSIEAIQKKILVLFEESIEYQGDIALDDFTVLLNDNDDKSTVDLRAKNVKQFLIFRAIQHFGNSQSFVSLPTEAYKIIDPLLFGELEEFLDYNLSTSNTNNHQYITLSLFQEALSLTELDADTRMLLDIKRAEYLNNFSIIPNKQKLYIDFLETQTQNESGVKGRQYAYIRLINHYINEGRRYANNFDSTYEQYNAKAYQYIQNAKKRFPEGEYIDIIENLQTKLNSRVLSVKTERVYTPGSEFLVNLDYRNIRNVHLRLVKLDKNQLEELNNSRNIKDRIAYASSLKSFSSWEESLLGSGDFNQHATELPVQSLDFGTYLLLASNNENFKFDKTNMFSFALFDISNLSYTYVNKQEKSYGYVLDRTTGEPINNATVEQYKTDYNRKTRKNESQLINTLKSDNNGRFSVEEGHRNFTFILSKGDDVLDLEQRHYSNGSNQSRELPEVQLYTDRGIYRPGQTIYFKGLSLIKDSDNRIPIINTEDSGIIYLRDVNYQVVAEYDYKVNEYGTFSGSIQLPDEVLTGNFNLTIDNKAHLNIKVEEYKRPKIYVEFDPSTEAYKLGDSIDVSGILKSFSGVTNEGAKVIYRVTKSPIRHYYYNRYWSQRFPSRNEQKELVASGEKLTQEDGSFNIQFPTTIETESEYKRYAFRVDCDITDIIGETTQSSKTLILSLSPFTIDADIPQSAFNIDLDKIIINTRNSESQDIATNLNVKVYSLEFPDRISRQSLWKDVDRPILDSAYMLARFPLDASLPQDFERLPLGNIVISDELDSGTEWNKLATLKSGLYRVVIEAIDNNGNTDIINRFVAISDTGSKAVPIENLLVSKLHSQYQPGDQLSMHVSTPFDNYNLLYKISHAQDTREEEWHSTNDSTIEYNVRESDRGGLKIDLLMVKHNRIYQKTIDVSVPWSNKELDVMIESFRDKVEPGYEENYKISISDKDGSIKDAELLASIYDSSLDQFMQLAWGTSLYPSYNSWHVYSNIGFNIGYNYAHQNFVNNRFNTNIQFVPSLNHFGLSLSRQWQNYDAVTVRSSPKAQRMSKSAPEAMMNESAADSDNSGGRVNEESELLLNDTNSPSIPVRENLDETVFFYPDVIVKDGKAEISFTMNEALTTWKLRMMVHNKDLQVGYVEKTIMTQKNLIIEPHLPRFLRQGDKVILNAKVSNLSNQEMTIQSRLNIEDAISQENLNTAFDIDNNPLQVTLSPGKSENVEFEIQVPDDFTSAVIIKMISDGGAYKDGEQSILPVLSNRKLVTESTVFHIPSNSNSTYHVAPIYKIGSSETLDPHNYTIEVSSNPAWVVAKTIPYLLDADMVTTDNILGALYGTMLGKHLVDRNPDIKRVIQVWNEQNVTQSPLNKNNEFKISDVSLTPWLRDAQAEEENMRKLSFLIDDNNVKQSINNLQNKLAQRQTENGGFVWTSGGRDNWYVTQRILEDIGHLKNLGIDVSQLDDVLLARAHKYCDDKFLEYHERVNHKNNEYVNQTVIQYLYTKSLYPSLSPQKKVKELQDYYWSLLEKSWIKQNTYMQGMICISAKKLGKEKIADTIYKSLNERMIIDAELGNYWNDLAGYYWYNPSIEKQALLIELYEYFDAEQEVIDGLKLWLLKNKQVNAWKTTKATASAVYAFMIDSDSWLAESNAVEVMMPKSNKKVEFHNVEYATGYAKTGWAPKDIEKDMSELSIKNTNNHIAWGAGYFQYWEDLNNITVHNDTPLKLKKTVYKVGIDDNGEVLNEIRDYSPINVGDKLRIKIELSVDRPMEFIQMKDMRSSGLEPLNVISQYKWQGGLGYYESTKDLASYFYIDNLPKGNFVFEYDVYASHSGQFSNGVTEIQSMYAPEFGSHSEGIAITIE